MVFGQIKPEARTVSVCQLGGRGTAGNVWNPVAFIEKSK